MERGYLWRRLWRGARWPLLAFALLLAWARWAPMAPLFHTPYSTVLLDGDGHMLGAMVAPDGQWRMPPGDSIPWRFEQCLIEFEDRHFHSHLGVYLPSLVRAFQQNRRAGRTVSGGSTLTMQVARMARPGSPRTLWNKVVEVLIAFRLELRTDKDAILALYAAHAPFGGNVVGLEAAAWRWYGRPPAQLGWAECATLAVLPNAPATIHPGRNRDALQAKRDRLLTRLLHTGVLDSLSWSLAMEEVLPEEPLPLPRRAPHLLGTLHQQGHAGERIRSTVEGHLQDRANTIVERHMATQRANEVFNAAVLILDVATGEVLAHVGNAPGAGPGHSGSVDITRARRSTGSLLKPFLYADMLQAGSLMPDQLVADLPTYYEGFAPRNFDQRHSGAVPASRALARSLNIPAVRALQAHGVERTLRKLRAMGLSSLDRSAEHYGLTLILGGAEGTLWELTGAYASLARIVQRYPRQDGVVHAPRVLWEKHPAVGGDQASPISAAAAYHTLRALQQADRPDADAGWQHFSGAGHIAWKTGTSFGHRDAWAIGLTDRHAVGVWLGNASGEGRPGLTGTLAAAPLLFELFAQLPAGHGFDAPMDAMQRIAVCRKSGHRTNGTCDAVDSTWVISEALRTAPCPYHRPILVNAAGTHRTRPGPTARAVPWFVLPAAMEHFLTQWDPYYRPLPAWEDNGMAHEEQGIMEVVYPEHGAKLLVPLVQEGVHGAVVLHAAHRDAGARVHWDLGGRYLGHTDGDHRLPIDLPPGPQRLTLTDEKGRSCSVSFQVVRNSGDPGTSPSR